MLATWPQLGDPAIWDAATGTRLTRRVVRRPVPLDASSVDVEYQDVDIWPDGSIIVSGGPSYVVDPTLTSARAIATNDSTAQALSPPDNCWWPPIGT